MKCPECKKPVDRVEPVNKYNVCPDGHHWKVMDGGVTVLDLTNEDHKVEAAAVASPFLYRRLLRVAAPLRDYHLYRVQIPKGPTLEVLHRVTKTFSFYGPVFGRSDITTYSGMQIALDLFTSRYDELLEESTREAAIADIHGERDAQINKWGHQSRPSVMVPETDCSCGICGLYNIPSEEDARDTCEAAAAAGECTWADIALEEFCEVINAPDDATRRGELVQLAAVATQWIQDIDIKAGLS